DIDGLITRDLPKRVSVLRQSTVEASPYNLGNGQALFDVVNAGVSTIAYFGHGGNAIWADPLQATNKAVLDNTQIGEFHNVGRYPVILSMTCFTAGYDGPSAGILNEMLKASGGGAIACMGTTSFGWEQNDEHLA